VRIPSGVAYALEARRAMEDVAPERFATSAVRRIDDDTTRLRRILQRIVRVSRMSNQHVETVHRGAALHGQQQQQQHRRAHPPLRP